MKKPFIELRLFRDSRPKKHKELKIESSELRESAITWASQFINPNWDRFYLLEYFGHNKDYGFGTGYDPIATGSCE